MSAAALFTNAMLETMDWVRLVAGAPQGEVLHSAPLIVFAFKGEVLHSALLLAAAFKGDAMHSASLVASTLQGGLQLGEVPFDAFVRLLVAAALGAVIGFEREVTGKHAGLRTMILICVGAALFTQLSQIIGGAEGGDPSRIASNIVTGIGFLGAGTIIHQGGSVKGLTTAATIWVTAAVGIAAGAGDFMRATGATILVILILVPLRWWEERAKLSDKEPDEDDAGQPKS